MAGLLVFGVLVVLLRRIVCRRYWKQYGDAAGGIFTTGMGIIINVPLHGLPVSMKLNWLLLGVICDLLFWRFRRANSRLV